MKDSLLTDTLESISKPIALSMFKQETQSDNAKQYVYHKITTKRLRYPENDIFDKKQGDSNE